MESFGMLLLACVLIMALIPFIAELSEMKKEDLKPMKEPVKGKTKKLSKKYIKVIYDNRYTQSAGHSHRKCICKIRGSFERAYGGDLEKRDSWSVS